MPFLSLLVVAFMAIALVDIITRVEGQTKHLPKFAWIILVILLPFIGSLIWFIVGRVYPERTGDHRPPVPVTYRGPRGVHDTAPPRYAPPADARSTEQQLADLEREIEEDRLRAEVERRRGESNPTDT